MVDTNKPWVNLLKAIYFPTGSFMDVADSHGPTILKAFLKACAALRYGFEFKVGDGMSSFWYTPWCTPHALCHSVDYVHYYDAKVRIKDVWDGEQ